MKFLRILFLCIIVFASNAWAEDNDIYVVRNIEVVREDADSIKARALAIAEAERKAFEGLGKRLLEYGYIEAAPQNVSAIEITSAIQKMAVVDEKVTDTLYKATLDFTFNPRVISRLMDVKIIAGRIKRDKFLIIPVTTDKGNFKIWGHEWYDAWVNYRKDNLIVPLGDLEDMKMLKEKELKKNDYTGIDALARKYNAPKIILAKAEYITSNNTVEVQLEIFEGYNQDFYQFEYPGGLGIGAVELYGTAANDIVYRLDNNKLDEVNKFEPEEEYEYQPDYGSGNSSAGMRTIEAVVYAEDLAEWSEIRQKIMNAEFVEDVLVTSFSAGTAKVDIKYTADKSLLIDSFRNQGLELYKTDENQDYWEVKESYLELIIETPELRPLEVEDIIIEDHHE